MERPATAPCPICSTPATYEALSLAGYALARCTTCDLRFAPTAVNVAVDYDSVYDTPEYIAGQVEQYRQGFDAAAFARHPTYRAFFDRVPAPADGLLLDLGCGAGRFLLAARALGWRVVGSDVSASALEIARSVIDAPLMAQTATELTADPQRYDVVTAFEVLEHVADPLAFVRTAQMLLRPGGHFFATVPNWDCRLVRETERPDWVPPVHLSFFTAGALRRLGETAGLQDVSVGVVWSDPRPQGMRPTLHWLWRKLRGSGNAPLGLWLHGRHRPPRS